MRHSMAGLAVAMAAMAGPTFTAEAQVSRDVTVAGPSGVLAGSWIEAPSGGPVVVIIPGSGPTDRNGNNPLGVAGGAYQRLAEALAERGVGSVRIDKRGTFASAAAAVDPNAVRTTDYAEDVRAWMAEARRLSGADCVWVLGHSEGGLVGTLAVLEAADSCGLILLSAPGRRLSVVMREQIASNPANAPLLPQVDAIIASLEAGEAPNLTGVHPGLAGLFNPVLNTYFQSLFSHDPAEALARYVGPVLVVQGETDLQVRISDAERLAAAKGLQPVIIAGMNHVLRDAPADPVANAATYALTEAELSPGLVEAIAGFITANAGPGVDGR
jgi:pimeloyl-ACP methyl ester carboxylesterase